MEQAREAETPAKTPRPHPAPDGVQMETVANISGGGVETLPVPVGHCPNLDLIPEVVYDDDDGAPWIATRPSKGCVASTSP